jgi:hypothetical protein
MAETLPSSGDRTVVVHRHGVLTWISLAFNALILLLILIGIVCHHHERAHRGHGGWGGHHERQDRSDRGHGDFDRHDAGPMHRDGGPRDEDRGPGGDDQRGWGGDKPGFGGSGPGDFRPPDHKPMPPSSEAMTDRFMLMMTEKLALTDQESAQIRPIVQGQIEQFQKDMAAQKAAHQKMIEDAKTQVRAVLTPDQQKQFDQLTAGLGAPPPAPPEKPTAK